MLGDELIDVCLSFFTARWLQAIAVSCSIVAATIIGWRRLSRDARHEYSSWRCGWADDDRRAQSFVDRRQPDRVTRSQTAAKTDAAEISSTLKGKRRRVRSVGLLTGSARGPYLPPPLSPLGLDVDVCINPLHWPARRQQKRSENIGVSRR